jgi:MFS family permease
MDSSPTVSQPSPVDTPTGVRARPFWLIVLALLWPAQLVNMSAVITSVAQAQVAQVFHTSQIAWFNVIYALIGTLLLPFAVKLSDMYGKRRVAITLVLAGLVGDVVCALAPSFGVLIAGRAIAACYVPVAALMLAAARDVVAGKRMAPVTGAIGAASGGIIAIGPLIAGWLLDSFGFRGAMWFIVFCTVVGLVLIVAVLPETPRHAERGGFDWLGGGLLAIGLLAVMSGMGGGSQLGWTSAGVLGPIVLGIVLLVAFVFVEKRVRYPILDLAMLSRRRVATVLGASSLLQGSAFATAGVMTVVIPLFPHIPGVSDGLGWTALYGALVGLPAGAMLFLAGGLAVFASRRVGTKTAWLTGVPIAIAGLVLAAFFHHNATQIILVGIVTALGTGIIYGCTPILVMESVSTKEQAQASGMSLMLVGLMATLGAQILFTVLNANSTIANGGTAFYHDAGYQYAYLVMAGVFVIGLLVSVGIPLARRVER